MKVCTYCQFANREGHLFCEECGNPLYNKADAGTRQLKPEASTDQPSAPKADDKKPLAWGATTRLSASNTVLMRIEGAKEPLILPIQTELLVGRADPSSDHYPDVDLVPFGAVDQGVSRSHARLQRTENTLNVVDMNSANGTYLNGQRLVPLQPRIVHDGDEVRFGKLTARIYFQSS